jgi:hypothetical protein
MIADMTNRVELSINEHFFFADGHEFGSAGAYERLIGRANFAVEPGVAAQRGVTDLDKAPTDADGFVHFAGDFSILKPVDPAYGNRRLFFDYGNRGNKRMLQFFNDAPASNDPRTLAHAGNGFLMRRGYSVVWLAWQGDLLPGNGRMLLDLPVAGERARPNRIHCRPLRYYDVPAERPCCGAQPPDGIVRPTPSASDAAALSL